MVGPEAVAGVEKLRVRSFWLVVLAYLVGALAGAGTGAITYLAVELTNKADAAAGIGFKFSILLETVGFLFVICLIFEVIIATPLIIVFRMRNWRPPNLIFAAVLGFAVSGLMAAAISSVPSPDGTSGPLGYFTGRELTMRGWWRLVRNVAEFGAIGAVTAAAFNLVAIRRKN
jgi:hypothetical protein